MTQGLPKTSWSANSWPTTARGVLRRGVWGRSSRGQHFIDRSARGQHLADRGSRGQHLANRAHASQAGDRSLRPKYFTVAELLTTAGYELPTLAAATDRDAEVAPLEPQTGQLVKSAPAPT